MEKRLKALEKRVSNLEQLAVEEHEFIELFQQIEACDSFEELEMLAMHLHAMKLPKVETFMMALALRIRQNTITTQVLDEALHDLRNEVIPEDGKWQ
jgi:hypothetical protein